MTDQITRPPREAACLSRIDPSEQRGGTLVAEDVVDLASHQQRLVDPDGYRPASCPSCGCSTLHLHDYRKRVCRQRGSSAVTVARYRCAGCRGRWQVLPAFIPRHLSHHWPVIEEACGRADGHAGTPVERVPSTRTRARWLSRLRSSARVLVQVLASSAGARLVATAQNLGLDPTRQQLLDALAQPLAAVAGLIHRLIPGVRLM
jgi:hypothetical protein